MSKKLKKLPAIALIVLGFTTKNDVLACLFCFFGGWFLFAESEDEC